MIWRQRHDRLYDLFSKPHRWFAWHPIRAKMQYTNSWGEKDFHWVWVWFSWVRREFSGGGEWKYEVTAEDNPEAYEQFEAIRLAPKYAKEIIMMDKVGG